MTDSVTKTKAPARKRPRRKADVIDPARYNEIVKQSSLHDVHLIQSSFSMNPEYLSAALAGDEINFSIHEDNVGADYRDDSDTLTVVATWAVKGGPQCAPESLTANIAYIARFEVGTGWTPNEITFFAQRVGVSTVYPYFRQHLNHLSAEAGALIPVAPIRKAIPVRVKGGVRNEVIAEEHHPNAPTTGK